MSKSSEGNTTARFWKWLIPGVPAALFAVFALMMQTGADDATKNVQSYADKFDLVWPAWLTAGQVMLVLGLLTVAGFVYVFRGALRTLPRRSMAAYRAFRQLPPSPTAPPTAEEIVAVNDVRSTFRNVGAPAADQILSLCRDAQNDAALKPVTFTWLVEQEKVSLRDAKSRVDAVLGDRGGVRLAALKGAFPGFLSAYGNVVRAAHDLEREGVDLLSSQHAQAYRDWESVHAKLLDLLNTMKEQPLLAHLGPVLQEKLSSGTGMRYASFYGRATKMFALASPNERAFLQLFGTQTGPSKDSPIDFKVHEAGLKLAKDKILKVEDGEGGVQRFLVPEPVRHAWFDSSFGPFVRESVEIHPSVVVMPPGVPYPEQGPSTLEPEQPTKPPTLSAEDAYNIQFARGFWRAVGNDASGDVEWLLLGVVEELAPTVRLARFLDLGKNRIKELREHLDIALADRAQTPLSKVTESLVTLFNVYMEGVRWLHECSDTHGVNLEAEPHAPRYRHWQRLHPEFLSKIVELSNYEGYSNLRYPTQHESATEIRFKKAGA
jgi:hypothetical protein